MRNVYRPLGFHKGYNFPLFITFAGAMLGFTLAKISNLNISGSSAGSFKSQAAPGEWYYFSQGRYRFGITLHLATVLPAGLLMVWQFVPFIRKRYRTFHRMNGYAVIFLIVLSNVGALMIARRSFGGGLDVQAAVGALVILSTTSLSMALWNIWCLQIDQHRAWMLRAVFYMGTIITARLIQLAAAAIISRIPDYYQVQTCGQVASNYGGMPSAMNSSMYPQCSNATASIPVVVTADMHGSPEQMGASLGLSFGMALWMSILLHLVGVEIYLNLTPGETHRMRLVSYERQLEAGFDHPGSTGITADRWGDAPAWQPERRDRPEKTSSTVLMV
ncbi:hypothetical protein L207DRAFT_485407 [Hyaloscypha variabilis F]|uniref:DUF2306 domain-containing protein n=1 Tax=Hyaloscypha variabilis (strain UAMH 11265 / GT02V1 / F) TaxID=1149755 RepID=A0A2J6RTY4_HYAVF|nr:hypothetical protein L207DRAFT_485407 [Hyaloscypha variabilis F]